MQLTCGNTDGPAGLVPVATYVAEMEKRWTSDLGNVATVPLREQWAQIASVLNHQVAAFGTPAGQEWQVITAATGTSKTKGLAVYCALLAGVVPFEHPGVLIVTKLRDEADDLASTINEWSGGRTVALSYHGEAQDVSIADLATYSVLVITHAAYQRALDTINRDSPTLKSWAAFMRYLPNGGTRKLVVIDEAIQLTEEATVDVDVVTRVLGYIPLAITQQFPREVRAIRDLRDHLERLAMEKSGGPTGEAILNGGAERLFGDVDLTEFRRQMMSVRYDHANMIHDTEERRRVALIVDGIFRQIQLTLERWLLYAKVSRKGESKHTLNTARLLIPDYTQGCVVLDATARINPVYQLFDRARIWPRIAGTRSYRNVRLHISTGHSVGRGSILRDPEASAAEFIGALADTLRGREVFLIGHKDMMPALASALEDHGLSGTWHQGHWGAITGRNLWKNCEAVAVLGLPYKPDLSSALEFMAFRGVQTDDWLANRGHRGFAGHADIRHALRVGGIAAELVQGLNRTRFRKVIDADGNCAEGDAYLLLPNGTLGEEVVALIREEMPDIQVIAWQYHGAKSKARPSRHGSSLAKWLPSMPHGRMTTTEVRQRLHIPQSTWKELIGTLTDPASPLATAMTRCGIRYERGGGRGCPSRLVRM